MALSDNNNYSCVILASSVKKVKNKWQFCVLLCSEIK